MNPGAWPSLSSKKPDSASVGPAQARHVQTGMSNGAAASFVLLATELKTTLKTHPAPFLIIVVRYN